jgi:hypothetical protein
MMIDRYIKFNLYISSKKTWNAENLTNALIDEILSNSKNSSLLSQIEIFFLLSNFDHRFAIIYEYVYDITLFIIRKSTNKSKNKIKFSSHICEVMSIINKMIKSNDLTSLSMFTITVWTTFWSRLFFKWCSTQKWNLKMLFKKISKSTFLLREIALYTCRK